MRMKDRHIPHMGETVHITNFDNKETSLYTMAIVKYKELPYKTVDLSINVAFLTSTLQYTKDELMFAIPEFWEIFDELKKREGKSISHAEMESIMTNLTRRQDDDKSLSLHGGTAYSIYDIINAYDNNLQFNPSKRLQKMIKVATC